MQIFKWFQRAFGGLVCLSFIAACSPKPAAPRHDTPNDTTPPFTLTLTKTEKAWRLDIELFEPQAALMFSRSKQDYRVKTYKALSQGVELERIGGFDTIIFDPNVMHASFEVLPFTETLPGTYTPFIPFSDGGQAIYLGAFELLRVVDVEAVADLQGNLDLWDGIQFDIPVYLKSNSSILLNGNVLFDRAETSIHGNGPYAYIGPTPLVESGSFSGVLDPNLPHWLVESLDGSLSKIFQALEDGFGYELENKATIMFAFRGHEEKGLSVKGSVLPNGLMVLETSGDSMRDPSERLQAHFQWFLTHEAAHLFQHPNGVSYADRSDNWILEGGANAITHSLLDELQTVPDEVIQARYKDSFKSCVEAIRNRSMAEIIQRHDQSHYDCGDFVFRIADAALPEHDIFDIWAALLAQMDETQSYDTEKYFTALRNLGAENAIVTRLEKFISGPVQNPTKDLNEMMKRVGIKAELKDGALTSIQFP